MAELGVNHSCVCFRILHKAFWNHWMLT